MIARLLLVFVLLCSWASSQNALVIVADDLGTERVRSYGVSESNAETPYLNLLSQFGTRVETAWSMPICSPTRATILTGRYPFRTGVGSIFESSGTDALKGSEITIAEVLVDTPSAIFGKWHLADVNQFVSSIPLTQGFDHFEGTLTSFPTQTDPSNNYFVWDKITNGVSAPAGGYSTTIITDDAIEWISGQTGNWFALVAYHAPHPPYHAPPSNLHSEELEGDPSDTPSHHHKAMTEALDTEIGRLLSTIDLDNTLVIVVGDNGTPAAAVDGDLTPDHAKGSLYEGGIHVPMFVYGPEVEARTVMGGVVSVADIFPTVISFMGYQAPESDGVDLLQPLYDGRDSPRETVFSERFKLFSGGFFNANETARNNRYKLIVRRTQDLEEFEFYDLLLDPLETQNKFGGPFTDREIAALDELSSVLDELGEK